MHHSSQRCIFYQEGKRKVNDASVVKRGKMKVKECISYQEGKKKVVDASFIKRGKMKVKDCISYKEGKNRADDAYFNTKGEKGLFGLSISNFGSSMILLAACTSAKIVNCRNN